jgi:hypothetical protein
MRRMDGNAAKPAMRGRLYVRQPTVARARQKPPSGLSIDAIFSPISDFVFA